MDGNKMYKQHKGIITKQADFYSKKWGVDYLEVEGEALEVFVKALSSYDSEKASFGTHLQHQLRALNYWCKIRAYSRGREVSLEEITPVEVKQIKLWELQESIMTELSEGARLIVKKVLDGSLLSCKKWEHLFSINRVESLLNLSNIEAHHYVYEIENWWCNFYSEV